MIDPDEDIDHNRKLCHPEWTAEEVEAIRKLSEAKEMTPAAIVRQALRHYQQEFNQMLEKSHLKLRFLQLPDRVTVSGYSTDLGRFITITHIKFKEGDTFSSVCDTFSEHCRKQGFTIQEEIRQHLK